MVKRSNFKLFCLIYSQLVSVSLPFSRDMNVKQWKHNDIMTSHDVNGNDVKKWQRLWRKNLMIPQY